MDSKKPKGTFAKLKSSTPQPEPEPPSPFTENGEKVDDTVKPRNRDTIDGTVVSRSHDTTNVDEHIYEVVRKAVKQIGKEAATYRYTVDEKNFLSDIKYTYKRQGINTSENEVTRIAINFFAEDYRKNGERSLLAEILKRLNS